MNSRERKEKYIREGRCVVCGHNKKDDGNVTCQSCIKKTKIWQIENHHHCIDYRKRRIKEHREKGLCLLCNSPPEKGKLHCRKCLNKAQYQHNQQEERKRLRQKYMTDEDIELLYQIKRW